MSFLNSGNKGTIRRQHVFGGGTGCVWGHERGRGLMRARVAAVVSVSAQHGCHSGFVSWWNRVPESCLWMTALLNIQGKTAPCHKYWTDIGGDHSQFFHSLVPCFSIWIPYFLTGFIFSFIQKQRKILTEFCRPASRSSFILTSPTAWHSVCWPSSLHLEGEAWGRGISGWRRWSLLKRWAI